MVGQPLDGVVVHLLEVAVALVPAQHDLVHAEADLPRPRGQLLVRAAADVAEWFAGAEGILQKVAQVVLTLVER